MIPRDHRDAKLIRILYGEKEKNDMVIEAIDDLLRRAEAAGLLDDWAKDAFLDWNTDFLNCLALLLASLKHEAYASEAEYRFVVTHDFNKPTLARQGQYGIVPYVTLACRDANELPLKKVVVGPSHYPATARFAVRRMLIGIVAGDDITNSGVPKRT